MITVTSLTLLEEMRGSGGEDAWHEFFRRYGPFLVGFAKRLGLSNADANDAAQDTLLAVHAAFREMEQPFDRSKGRFKSWLRGIAVHKVRDLQRRNRRAAAAVNTALDAGGGDLADPATDSRQVDEVFEREWQRNLLSRCMERVAQEVDPIAWQSFELYALRGQPPHKVASLLGISRNAVYINKTRIMQRIKIALAAIEQEEDA